MSDSGASNGEMSFKRISDKDMDRVLSGSPSAAVELRELAAFARSTRASLQAAPRESLGTALVPRLADAALEGPVARRAGRSPRLGIRRRTLFARVAVAAALLPALLAGLAFAGVKLPDAADSAFDAVGVTLPNQDAGKDEPGGGEGSGEQGTGAPAGESSDTPGKNAAGKGKSGAHQPKGKAKGRNGKGNGRAGAPGQSDAKGNGKANGNGGGGNAGGNGKGKAVGRTDAEPPGQAKKPPPPPQSNAGGNGKGKP